MENNSISKKGSPNDHLANERTFLAWIRTSISLMVFGFVVVKFALFIRQVTIALGNPAPVPQKGYSAVIGVMMVAMGAVVAVLSFLRYRKIEKQLSAGDYFPSSWLSVLVTLCIVIGSILLVLFLLPNI